MKLIVFSLLLISSSSFAAMSSKEFQAKLDDIYTKQAPRFEGCKWQNNVLKKPSVKALEEITRADEGVELTVNEASAMKILEQFDYKKDFPGAREEYSSVLVKNCSDENFAIFSSYKSSEDLCEYSLDDMTFFQAMIYASQNQNWKPENVKKLKDITMSSIKNKIDSNSDITTYMAQLAILKDMMAYKLINDKNLKEVSSLLHHAHETAKSNLLKSNGDKKDICSVVVNQMKKNDKLKKVLKDKTLKIISSLK